MFLRDCYPELTEHLKQKQVTVITGLRRVGKSTVVKHLLDTVTHKNKIYLDCERIEIRQLLNRPHYESIAAELQLNGLDFSKPCVIALDEIQLAENLPSLIKYFYDTYKIKFIVTGSSSYYIKNLFSESLAGRKRIFNLYPLNFKEFLQFNVMAVHDSKKYAWKTFDPAWYNKNRKWYQQYLQYGGFPEVALQKKEKRKRKKRITQRYFKLLH